VFYTETASRKQRQTIAHARTLVFWCQKSQQNSNRITPNGGAKCRWGRLNAVAVAAYWQLSTRSVVTLARSQVYHNERPRYLFAARDAARRAGLSATADPFFDVYNYTKSSRVVSRVFAIVCNSVLSLNY